MTGFEPVLAVSAVGRILWGLVVTALALLAWGGQTLSWLAPTTAVKWKVMEAEEDVEETYWADIRGEALWDTFTLWAMVAAGFLLLADHGAWPYFGLVGGGVYLYFAGRGIATRLFMRAGGLRIGAESNVKLGFAFCVIWGLMALAVIVTAIAELEGRA